MSPFWVVQGVRGVRGVLPLIHCPVETSQAQHAVQRDTAEP